MKFGSANNDAAFQCIFLFNIFFSLYGYYLFPLNWIIDSQLISLNFALDFAILLMWLQMDGQTNERTDELMNGPMDGKCFSFIQMQ